MNLEELQAVVDTSRKALAEHGNDYDALNAAHSSLCEAFGRWMRENREAGVANDMNVFKELTLLKLRLANACASAGPRA